MKNTTNWLGMLVLVLVFGLTAVGCEEDPPEEIRKEPRTLVITMPLDIFKQDFKIGLFRIGTSLESAKNQIGIIAGATSDLTPGWSNTENDPTELTVPLYTVTDLRWYGNGTYDVYAAFYDIDDIEEHYYKSGYVNFSSSKTSINIDSTKEVF